MSQNKGKSSKSFIWRMLIVMGLLLGLYAIDGDEYVVGKFLNHFFKFIELDGKYPILTLMIMGSIMIILSTIVRTMMTDSVEQKKTQEFSKAFQKEFRQARIENNLHKLKKLTDMQPQIMAKTMESSGQMMNSMPYTMIIIVPVFLWVRYFVNVTLATDLMRTINLPWSMIPDAGVILTDNVWFIPVWILIYSLVSIPLSQIIMRFVRYIQFKKRLDQFAGKLERVT
ncbi:MAG: EMC3/TMCO1 family protein [archaeon]|nr:EMC3/TMCO1 family protein [archaeon]